ncbi:hypothetical protein [Streptomyces olivaceus]|uniref:hypothetical protein n=1 Tax=Streptomyces olivaceus TaxID=47716 RepID=UPI001D17C8F3|nr:hypothetical protein [Streptomyces olivaceus]
MIMLLLQGRVEDACAVLSRLAADVPPDSGPSWEFEMVRMWLADVYPGIFRRVACESRTNGTPVTPPGAIGYRLLEHFRSSHHQRATAERLGQADEALWQQPLTEINLLPLILALRTMVYAERLEEAEQRCRELMQASLDLQAPPGVRCSARSRRTSPCAAARSALRRPGRAPRSNSCRSPTGVYWPLNR